MASKISDRLGALGTRVRDMSPGYMCSSKMLYIQGGIALTIAGILMSYIYGRRVHEITQPTAGDVPPSIRNDTIIMLVVALLILWAGIAFIWKGACA